LAFVSYGEILAPHEERVRNVSAAARSGLTASPSAAAYRAPRGSSAARATQQASLGR
jgi:hypothetical protein